MKMLWKLLRNTSDREQTWRRVNSLLKLIFDKPADTKGIDAVMRHKDTKCIEVTHPVNNNTAKEKTIACIVFQTLDAPPYGSVIFYIALNFKFKTE